MGWAALNTTDNVNLLMAVVKKIMILVSYIFQIEHEYFFYIENYTFWVVTGLVSSSSAYKMNTHGMEHRGIDILWQCLKLKLDIALLLI